MLSRIIRRLEHVRLVVADTVREGRLLAVSLTPELILFDAQLSVEDARELLGYLGRASFTAAMPLAVLPGDEDEQIEWLLRTPDGSEPAIPSS
jgi:hypothetical protein